VALPGGITTITVTGSYLSATGAPAEGTVLFAPGSSLTDSTGLTILTGAPITCPLVAGAFSVLLPCTNSTALRPTPFYYVVTEAIAGVAQAPFTISLPSTLGSTVDMSALSPIPTLATPTSGLYVISVNGQSGSVTCPTGTATLVNGTAVVSNSQVTSASLIFLAAQSPAGTPGALYVSARTPGTSFTIRSTSATDASTVAYLFFPASP
jgi:hypothetical protein